MTLDRVDGEAWDAKQIALYAAFVENDLYGAYRLQPIGGQYYFSYLGGRLDGYETKPLSMGLAKTRDPLDLAAYQKLPQPILAPNDGDARPGERASLYKSVMFEDPRETLGYRYVNAYNAKGEGTYGKESIFLAVSSDGEHWERYGDSPILFDDSEKKDQKINGDPQILRHGDLYIMLYFIYDQSGAYNTFACSRDLIHWTKWTGTPLIQSEEAWENVYAHKPWVVVENGVVYHFYCAVNDMGERFIALATSKPM